MTSMMNYDMFLDCLELEIVIEYPQPSLRSLPRCVRQCCAETVAGHV